MAGVKDNATTKILGWPRGIDNLSAETQLPIGTRRRDGKVDGALREAVNIDLDSDGRPSRRPGYTLVEAAGVHSLYGNKRFALMLGVRNGQLVSYDADERRTDRMTLQARDARMSYDFDAGWVYFSNGFDSGRINDAGVIQPWAVATPIGQPTLAQATAGGLAAGYYQVAVTYRDADDRESGSTLAAEIEIDAGTGIGLSAIPQPSEAGVTTVRVYATEANGEVLRFVMDLPTGMTSATIGVHQPGKALATQFHEVLPPGEIVRIYRGRLYVVRNNVLYWSAANRYGQGILAESFLSFNGPGRMVEGVHAGDDAGMFVAFGKRTYFMSGPNPKKWQRAIAHPYGAVVGSSITADAGVLGFDDYTGELPYWLDDSGQFVVGLPDGKVAPLHADRYAGPVHAESATTVLREVAGERHLVSTVLGGSPNPLGITDTAEAEIWRDGVKIG